MSIRKYEAFVNTVELGSLTKAAEALGLTQSGVSHIINKLEDELGFTLMIRKRSGIHLTDNGERILPAMRGILENNQKLMQTVASIHGLNSGTVRIGAFTSVAVHWLPDMFKQYQKLHPKIGFKLFSGDYNDIEIMLKDGIIDLGFIAMTSAESYNCIPLLEDRLLAVLPKEHELADAPCFPLSRIPQESFINMVETTYNDTGRILDKAGIKADIKFTTKDDYAIIAMVENGLGISILPELLLEGYKNRIVALELQPQEKRTICLAIPSFGKPSPAAQSFAEFIQKWVENKYGNTI